MLRAVLRHVSLVSGLTGAFAAGMPALLLRQHLGQGPFSDPRLGYLAIEMVALGAVVFLSQVARLRAAALVAWAACGAGAVVSAWSVPAMGRLFVPAVLLFALSGLLADLLQPRILRRHLLLGGAAAALQAVVLAIL